jgi:hypothetical protein
MGTNYYRIPTASEMKARQDQLIQSVKDLDMSPDSVERAFGVIREDSWERLSCWDTFIEDTSIHLGKRSMGWKFCWNFHNNKYYSTREELLNFIKSGRVVDEYGAEIETDEFIQMALNWGEPNGLVFDEEYEKKALEKKPSTWIHGEKYWDKLIDGLRVSSSVDFS